MRSGAVDAVEGAIAVRVQAALERAQRRTPHRPGSRGVVRARASPGMAGAVMARVIVIGAGLGGLSAACHLAGKGHEVTVFERTDQPGGRATRRDTDGYSFDLGPTVLTMTGLLADTFAAAGADMDDHLTLRRLDPAYRAVYADGSTIRVRAGREQMAEEIRTVCGATDAEAFERFCAWLTELYAAERMPYIDRNYRNLGDLVRPLGPAIRLARLGGFGNLAAARQLLLRRRTVAPALQLPISVRGAGASQSARAVRGDHVHGHRRGRVPPRRRHGRGVAGARGRGPEGGRGGPPRARRSIRWSSPRGHAVVSAGCASQPVSS